MPPTRLLLVDDAPEVTFLVRRLTQRAGQELIACRDAPQALGCLENVQPDLAIVDVNLPGMSGPELCLHLRRFPGREETPIALFTHPRQTEDIVAGLEAGAGFILSKDLLAQPDAWLGRLEEILQACRGRGKTDPLEWSAGRLSLTLPGDGLPALNEALRHPALRQLGRPVVRLLLHRVVQRLLEALPSTDGQSAATAPLCAATWVLPGGSGLTSAAFPGAGRSRWVAACAIGLAEEIATVWGNALGHPACAVLTAAAGEAANEG